MHVSESMLIKGNTHVMEKKYLIIAQWYSWPYRMNQHKYKLVLYYRDSAIRPKWPIPKPTNTDLIASIPWDTNFSTIWIKIHVYFKKCM